jgi:hypothetical protein
MLAVPAILLPALMRIRGPVDYPFFGRDLERRVYRLDSARDLARQMRRLRVRAAVLPVGRPPEGLDRFRSASDGRS